MVEMPAHHNISDGDRMVITYPEMNQKIIGLLEMSGTKIYLYAAQRIRELEDELTW